MTFRELGETADALVLETSEETRRGATPLVPNLEEQMKIADSILDGINNNQMSSAEFDSLIAHFRPEEFEGVWKIIRARLYLNQF